MYMYNSAFTEYKQMPRMVSNLGLRKGAWTAEEDMLLKNCIEKYGEGKWHLVPLKAGLNRCRKSCRLRWLNYLRPNIKRGDFGEDEVDLMLRLHKLLGNRWSLIAGRIPGRTANDVKNYWNTHLRSRPQQQKNGHQDDEPSRDTNVTIIKPRPRTFSKTLNSFMGSHQSVTAHEDGILTRMSNDNVNNNFALSPGFSDCLDQLYDENATQIEGQVGWSFGGSPADREALNVVDQDGLLDFPIDDVVWDLLNSEHL